MRSSDIKSTLVHSKGGIVAALVIIGLGLLLGGRSIDRVPSSIHSWAQSDWYAIALGFTHNGYDLFHPETMIYNKQFPSMWKEASNDTVTSADFPIHGYIIALLMGLFGTTAPWVYRLWTLLCSLVGMWFLYLLGRRVTKSGLKAITVVTVAMLSPLYAYYFANYLPSAPAVACVLAGLWAYIKHRQEGSDPYWHLAMSLLTLGAMIRTSQAVVLVAVCGFELLRIIRHETTFWNKVPAVLLSAAAIGGYLLWNAHLRAEHGTLFLSDLLPLRGWNDIAISWQRYSTVYFSLPQQILILALTVAAVIFAIVNRKSRRSYSRTLPLWLLWSIWFFGELLFLMAMGYQFIDHEYYFLDSFYLPAIVGMTLLAKHIPLPTKTIWQAVTLACMLAALWPMYRATARLLDERSQGWDLALICHNNYHGSDQWLDELGIGRDARILSVASYPQNPPFLLMGRKGYTAQWMGDGYDMSPMLTSALQFPFDYVITEEWYLKERFDQYRVVFERLKPVASYGALWLCTAADTVVNSGPDDFFTQ